MKKSLRMTLLLAAVLTASLQVSCQSEESSSNVKHLPPLHMMISTGCSPHSASVTIDHFDGLATVTSNSPVRAEIYNFNLRLGTISKTEVEHAGPEDRSETTVLTSSDPEAFGVAIARATDLAMIIANGNVCFKPDSMALEVIAEIEAMTASTMDISSECSPHSDWIRVVKGSKTVTINKFGPETSKTWILVQGKESELYKIQTNFRGESVRSTLTTGGRSEYSTDLAEAIKSVTVLLNGTVCKPGNPAAAEIVAMLKKRVVE